MKKAFFKACASAVMAVVLLASMVAPVFAGAVQASESIDYVAVGDAITNGIGLDNKATESYVMQVVDYLGTDNYVLYARNGYRIEELRYLLDNTYAGDGYTQQLGGMNLERVNGKFKEYVVNADKMSITIGTNNFSTYIVDQMMHYLQNDGAVKYAYSFDGFLDSEVEKTMKNMTDLTMEYLLAAAPDEGDMALELIDFVTEVSAYTVLSYIDSFNAVMEEIYELNPDIELYVVGMHNPFSGNDVTFTQGDRTLTLPLGEAMGALVEMANAYAQILAPRAYNYTYVHPGDPELLIDRMGDTTRDDEERIPGALRLELLNAVEDTVTDMIKEMFDEYGIEKTDSEAYAIAEEIFACTTPEARKEYIRELMNDLAVDEVIEEFRSQLESYTDTYSRVTVTTEQIKKLLSDLEAAGDDAAREEIASDFVVDLMTKAMVGQNIDGLYIETQEDAYEALALLEKNASGDPVAMREAAADIIMKKVADNGLSDLITRADVIDLLTQLDAPSVDNSAKRRAVIQSWMHNIAIKKFLGGIQSVLPNFTQAHAETMLAAMEEKDTEDERKAVAKQHLLAEGQTYGFHAYLVNKFTAAFADPDSNPNTDDGLTLSANYATMGEFVNAMAWAQDEAAAKEVVRAEIRLAAAEKSADTVNAYLGGLYISENEVHDWYEELDVMAENGLSEGDRKVWLNGQVENWCTVALGGTFGLAFFQNSIWDAYTAYNNAATPAEEAAGYFWTTLDDVADAFTSYVELKDSAAEQILSAYENYYQGAGATAQQYYQDYITLRDEAVDKVIEGFNTYLDVMDKGMDAADQMNGKFEGVFDLMREIAEVKDISLNHLLSVAKKFDTNYVAEMVDNLVQGEKLGADEKTVAYIALRYYLADSVMVFPSEKGHKTIANQIIRAMKGENTNSAAGNLAIAIAEGTVDLYRLAKKYFDLPNTGSGQVDTIINPDLYVALGDDITAGTILDDDAKTYPELIGDALAMADDQFDDDVVANYALGGMRTEELLALVSGYAGDAYTESRYGIDYISGLRAQYRDNIKNADLITLNVGINNLTTYPLTQTLLAYNGEETYEMDWARYIGDRADKIIRKGKNVMIDLTLGIVDTAENRVPELDGISAYERCERAVNTCVTAIESMIYGMVGYIVNMDTAVEQIGELNPNATIVMIGFYNPMEGTYINIDKKVVIKDTTIDLGKYTFNVSAVFDKMINQANRIMTNFVGYYKDEGVAANAGSRFVTVDIKNAELAISDTTASKNLANLADYRTVSVRGHQIDVKIPSYFLQVDRTAGEALHPNATGHSYIAAQVLKSLDFEIYADLVFGEYTKNYGEPDPEFTYDVDDLSSLYPILKGKNFEIVREPGEEMGEYDVYANILDEGGYAEIDVVVGKLTITTTGTVRAMEGSLRLKDEIFVNFNAYFSGFDGWDRADMMSSVKLLAFSDTMSKDDCIIENAIDVIDTFEYDADKDSFIFHTDGIAAKDMDVLRYYRVYIEMPDDSIFYSGRIKYSPQKYCEDVLTRAKYSDDLKALCVSLMNYGAAAQAYFHEENGFEYDVPMNSADVFANNQYRVAPYDSTMLDERVAIDKNNFNFRNTNVWDGAFQEIVGGLNYNFSLKGAIEQNISIGLNSQAPEVKLYCWTEETYANLVAEGKKLTALNCDSTLEPVVSEDGKVYTFKYNGVSAKDMGKTVIFVVYIRVGATGKLYSAPQRMSIDFTAKSVINGNYSPSYKTLAKEMVVYGEYAKQYFANRTEQE